MKNTREINRKTNGGHAAFMVAKIPFGPFFRPCPHPQPEGQRPYSGLIQALFRPYSWSIDVVDIDNKMYLYDYNILRLTSIRLRLRLRPRPHPEGQRPRFLGLIQALLVVDRRGR